MTLYRCYFFDENGSITAWKPINCDTDAEADRLSTQLLADRPQHHAVEVWNLTRRAFHHARQIIH